MPKSTKKTAVKQQPDATEETTAAPIHANEIVLTQKGVDDLKAELNELKTVKLPAIIDRVAKAREYGDLSENSEYHSARDEQQLIETRIDEIVEILAKAKTVKNTTGHSKVGMGSQVTLKQGKSKAFSLTIVGEFEAKPGESTISSVSPLGKALMNKKKGDTVIVKAPAGETEYTIEDIK